MKHIILTSMFASISELKKHPMLTVARAHGKPLAILNRNKPVFYCVPAKRYEAMMEVIEDLQLIELIKSRAGDEEVEVDIDEL